MLYGLLMTGTVNAKDILIADFESPGYSGWTATGKAFGSGPVKGELPGQQHVKGFIGKSFADSFHGKDKAMGTLTSKEFKIRENYINFFIGGGNYPGKTCINLLINNKVVRSTTGKNNSRLISSTWNVSELKGKSVKIQIIDNEKGRWGHIMVDNIRQIPVNLNALRVSAGKFTKIYDPSIGEKKSWYINDHCFIVDKIGKWHLFGITHEEPAHAMEEDNFAHATAKTLLQKPWDKHPFALSVAPQAPWNEQHLWAPYVIHHNNLYYMYYCAGDKNHSKYKIHLATSPNMKKWTRHLKNPMVVDGFDARDPFVMRVNNKWVMYYTATSKPKKGNHVVAYVTSDDLVTWGNRGNAFIDPTIGNYGGPTESPFIVKRGDNYFLFIGPRGGYSGTDIFVSKNPFNWKMENIIGHIKAHAAEVIQDKDKKWYISRAGWGQGGVFLAPLIWNDGK